MSIADDQGSHYMQSHFQIKHFAPPVVSMADWDSALRATQEARFAEWANSLPNPGEAYMECDHVSWECPRVKAGGCVRNHRA